MSESIRGNIVRKITPFVLLGTLVIPGACSGDTPEAEGAIGHAWSRGGKKSETTSSITTENTPDSTTTTTEFERIRNIDNPTDPRLPIVETIWGDGVATTVIVQDAGYGIVKTHITRWCLGTELQEIAISSSYGQDRTDTGLNQPIPDHPACTDGELTSTDFFVIEG